METLCPTSVGWRMHPGQGTTWTKEENKKFESALAIFDEKTPNRWLRVASMIPGKSVCDVINQYKELVEDVSDIEAGLVPIPGYLASSFTLELADQRSFDACRKRARTCDQERKKGVPWTEEEHRRFLLGLQKHGKGDWRNISRNFVISKTPTQVASHAQKYYLRQHSGGKEKRRPSIHDITTVNLPEASATENHSSSSSSGNNNNNNPPLLEKYNELMTSMQSPTITPQIVLDWNHHNDGGLMLLGSACAGSFVAYPQEIATTSHCIVNIGGSTPGLNIQSPRFLGDGNFKC